MIIFKKRLMGMPISGRTESLSFLSIAYVLMANQIISSFHNAFKKSVT